MPMDNIHKSWETPSDMTSVSSASNPTSSCPRSWSLGNAALVVAERNGWRRVLGASKPRLSAKGAHPYRKRPCLEALRLATTKLTQRGTGYPSWGHPTQLRISRGSIGFAQMSNTHLSSLRENEASKTGNRKKQSATKTKRREPMET